jgi:plasmid stability protein
MSQHARQYTIRNVPDRVDRTLRRRAKETGQSFNQVVLDALAAGAGEAPAPKRDLSGVIGSLSDKEAERMDDEVRRQRQIDPELWR